MPAAGAATFWMNQPPAVEPLRLRRVTMLLAALCFAAGDVLAQRWHPPALLIAATLVLLLLAGIALARRQRVAAFPVYALWIVAGCWCAQMQKPIARQETLHTYADGLQREVQGRVVRVRTLGQPHEPGDDPAEPTDQAQRERATEPGGWEQDRGDLAQSIDLDLDAIEDVTPDTSTLQPVTGGLRVTVLGSAVSVRCGDRLTLPLRLRLPDSYRDPGAYSTADALLAQGIGSLATVPSDRVRTVGSARPSLACRLFAAQAWAARRLQSYVASHANSLLPSRLRLQPSDAAMLAAMLFGDRSGLTQTLRVGFERTGTFHLFVVSGLHVTLLAGLLMALLKKLRLRQPWAVAITLPALTAYALLTGFGVPVQRALGMTAAYLLARCFARESSPLNALGLAATAVLLLDPRALFEASFQMTFLVILAVAGIAVPLRERWYGQHRRALNALEAIDLDAALHPRLAAFRVRLRMAEELCAALLHPRARHAPVWCLRALYAACDALLFGVAIEACMVLPMAVYFHRAVLLGLPVNALCIPLIALLLAAAILTFCATLLGPWLALPFATVTALLLHAMRALIDHTGHLALAEIRLPSPATPALVAACAALAFACWALRIRSRGFVTAGVVAVLLLPLAVLWPAPLLFHPALLEVTALDVGQGDSLLVVSPHGQTLLVDSGGPVGRVNLTDNWDIGEEVVAPYLWSRRIGRLDAVLLTHAHSDHMGGMPAILRDFRPHELWLGVQPGGSAAMRALLAEAATLGIRIRWFRAGDAFPWGDLQATVLAPEATYANNGPAVNNDSLVLQLAFGQASVLLEGDAEAPSEAAMLANHRVTPVTLLKVGHHGSRTSTTAPFLQAAAPHDAVISVGRHNTFGHPRADVLERLQAAGTKTFRTDRPGAETFLLDTHGGISAAPAASN